MNLKQTLLISLIVFGINAGCKTTSEPKKEDDKESGANDSDAFGNYDRSQIEGDQYQRTPTGQSCTQYSSYAACPSSQNCIWNQSQNRCESSFNSSMCGNYNNQTECFAAQTQGCTWDQSYQRCQQSGQVGGNQNVCQQAYSNNQNCNQLRNQGCVWLTNQNTRQQYCATVCEQAGDQYNCSNVSNQYSQTLTCNWQIEPTTRQYRCMPIFNGTVSGGTGTNNCYNSYSQQNCQQASGCGWNLSNGQCTTCSTFQSNSSLCQQAGCRWDAFNNSCL